MPMTLQETPAAAPAIGNDAQSPLRNPDPHARPVKARRSRKKTLAIAAAALAAAIFAGRKIVYGMRHETTDNAQVEGHVVPVLPKVGGFVEQVFVSDNQRVAAGDTLFLLDTREFNARLKQAEARLMAAISEARNGSAGAGLAMAKSQEAVSRSNIEAAKAKFDKAAKDVKRFRDLSARDVVARSQLDAAESAYREAEASLAAAREQARGSNFGVAGADARFRLADARVLEAQADLEAARLPLDYAVVRAPAAGTIARKNLEVGQFVNPGQPLMSIVDGRNPWIIANFKETQTARLAVGQAARITLDAYPGASFSGRIESIQEATGARFSLFPPDNAAGNFTKVVQRVPVKILLDADPAGTRSLRPGMSAFVAIATGGSGK
jgi:membrane fusion protein (multidrug efflux system)